MPRDYPPAVLVRAGPGPRGRTQWERTYGFPLGQAG